MRAGHGVSKHADGRSAVEEAVEQAVVELGGREQVVAAMVFVGSVYDPSSIAAGLRNALKGVPHVGATTDGEISREGLSVDSVCVMLIASTKTTARTAVVHDLSKDSHAAGATIAQRLRSPESRALLMFPDGLTGNGTAIIRGAQEILGLDFVIAGGTAGDRGRFVQTWQFTNGEAHTDSVVALMFDSPGGLEVGTGVMSGWQPMGIAKTVTHAEENTVYTIEGETALDVYSRFLGERASQLPAIGVEYPFALVDKRDSVDTHGIRAGEEYLLLRAPMSVDRKTGAVTFAAEVPKGSKIKMTRARSADIIQAAREAATRALERIGGPPEVALFFSCMARKVVLGRRTNQEIETAQAVLGDTPLIGFYTYGEIANCGDLRPICRFHNETATFLVMRES